MAAMMGPETLTGKRKGVGKKCNRKLPWKLGWTYFLQMSYHSFLMTTHRLVPQDMAMNPTGKGRLACLKKRQIPGEGKNILNKRALTPPRP